MKFINTKPFGCKLTVVTNTKGEEYVLQGYVVNGYYLIPFVAHYNSPTKDFDPLYWEPHYAKKETWIPIDKVNFDEWDITREEFESISKDDDDSYKKILEKYHGSF